MAHGRMYTHKDVANHQKLKISRAGREGTVLVQRDRSSILVAAGAWSDQRRVRPALLIYSSRSPGE